MLVDDTSTAWDDQSSPDIHKAARYWRDRWYVHEPRERQLGSCPRRRHGDVPDRRQATGADFSNAVTVSRGGSAVAGSVAETSPGVLSWTPAAALAPGAYDVTVDNVQRDIGGDSVPMRQPYRFSFTVT